MIITGRFSTVVLIVMVLKGWFCEVVLIGMVPTVVLKGWFYEVVLTNRHLMFWEFSHNESVSWTDCIRIRPNILVLRLLLAGLVPAEDEEEEEEKEVVDRQCKDKRPPFKCKQNSLYLRM